MKFSQVICISFFICTTCTSTIQLRDHRDDLFGNGETADKIAPRHEDTASETSTIGLLPNLGSLSTGVPSLMGHGPAIQPQPEGNPAGTGREISPGTNNNFTTVTAGYNNVTACTTTNEASSDSFSSNQAKNAKLEVMDYQYTYQTKPRADITVIYGSSNITQTWEVRDGSLYLVSPDQTLSRGTANIVSGMPVNSRNGSLGINSTCASSGSVPALSNSTDEARVGGGTSSNVGSQSSLPTTTIDGNMVNDTSNPEAESRMEAAPRQPIEARPGFTGP